MEIEKSNLIIKQGRALQKRVYFLFMYMYTIYVCMLINIYLFNLYIFYVVLCMCLFKSATHSLYNPYIQRLPGRHRFER